MLSLVIRELWSDLKRQKGAILSFFFLWLLENVITYALIFHSDKAASSVSKETQFLLVNTVYLLLLLWRIFKNIPLRLSRGIFVCPAGNREKQHCLFLQLGVKILLCMILTFLLLYFGIGGIFISENYFLQTVQLLLWFFTFYNINLRVGIGERSGKELDEKGYYRISHAEEMVTVYWLCLLILEWTGFLVNFFFPAALGQTALWGIWSIAMACNLFFALRYTRPMLLEMCSYEKIYCQKQPDDIMQYDF